MSMEQSPDHSIQQERLIPQKIGPRLLSPANLSHDPLYPPLLPLAKAVPTLLMSQKQSLRPLPMSKIAHAQLTTG